MFPLFLKKIIFEVTQLATLYKIFDQPEENLNLFLKDFFNKKLIIGLLTEAESYLFLIFRTAYSTWHKLKKNYLNRPISKKGKKNFLCFRK